jgi:hypothetical protein
VPLIIKFNIKDNFDALLAISILFVSAIISIWLTFFIKQYVYAIGSFLVFITCAIYLIKRIKILSGATVALINPKKILDTYQIILNIIFIVLLICSIWSLYLRTELYIRPLNYFVIIILMAVILGVEILFYPKRPWFILLKVLMVGLSLRLTQVLIFPNVAGNDPWFHQNVVTDMLNYGHIPAGNVYSKLPMMHLLSGETSLITGLNYKMSALLSITSIQVICDSLFVFLIARLIFGKKDILLGNKIGLLAALLICIANHHVYMGYLGIPNTMGATLILPIIYVLFTKRNASIKNILLCLLLMFALILTHALATMCLIVLIFVFWLGFYVYKIIYKKKTSVPVALNIVALFSVGSFGWWLYISGHINIFAHVIKNILTATQEVDMLIVGGQAPFIEAFISYIGILLFLSLSLIGLFYMLSKLGNKYSFILAVSGTVLFGITVSSMFGGRSDAIIGHRWIYFCQIILAIPLGASLVFLQKTSVSRFLKNAIPFVLICIISFSMIISPQENFDNKTFCPTGLVRYSFTESELKGMKTVTDYWDGKIASDWYSRFPILHLYNKPESEFVHIQEDLVNGDFINHYKTAIVIREYVITDSFKTKRGITKLDYDPCMALSSQGFARFYDCGSLSSFINF